MAYSTRKKKIVVEFMDALKQLKPRYDHLLELTREVPSFFLVKEVEAVFVLLSGKEEKRKKVLILNDMLIDWIGTKRRIDGGFPAPGTINSTVRAFFAAAKTLFDWHFSPNDFNFDGGYSGFFKALCAERQKANVSQPSFFILSYKQQQQSLTFLLLLLSSYHHLLLSDSSPSAGVRGEG